MHFINATGKYLYDMTAYHVGVPYRMIQCM